MPIKLIVTEDGSHSLFDSDLNETYHSTRGARGESEHVFIREGIEYFLTGNKTEELRILEVGLGTGLNAFLSALFSMETGQKIHLTSLEPFPVNSEIYENLNYHSSGSESALLLQIHEAEWEKEVALTPGFTFLKTQNKLEEFEPSKSYELIFFDAFAPSKQPEVWSLENLRKCFEMLNPGGVLTTYCAQGQFKRNLTEVGFVVETLQGAMGKKEMVRATKPS